MNRIKKRNGMLEDYNPEQILKAIEGANSDLYGKGATPEEIAVIYQAARREVEGILNVSERDISVDEINDIVVAKMMKYDCVALATQFIEYRYQHKIVRESNTTDKSIKELISGENEYWKGENSNKNPVLVTTQRDYIAGITSTDISRRFLLPKDVVKAHDEGMIHFHDIDYFAEAARNNCCLVNLEDMLQNGTVLNNVMIEKPHRFLTAMNIATQIILAVSSSQYGGVTVSMTHLAPFVRSSYEKFYNKYIEAGLDEELSKKLADADTHKEIVDGVQTFNYQVNSMTSTNGQAPFISVCLDINEDPEYREEIALITEEFFKQRIQGLKNEYGVYVTQAFPKLLYVLDENNVRDDSEYYWLTKLAAECTAKRMVPDYISAKKMREYKINQYGEGDVYPCMGCVDGKEVITYRYKGLVYTESFERMWRRLSQYFDIKLQPNKKDLYMDTPSVEVYDQKRGFVNNYRVIKNLSKKWYQVTLKGGRTITVTEDHPFETENRGVVLAKDLNTSDEISLDLYGNKEIQSNSFNKDLAWFYGFVLCDGSYRDTIFASIAMNGEDDIQKRFVDFVKNYYGLDVRISEKHRGKKGNYKDLILISKGDDTIVNLSTALIAMFGGRTKNLRHIPNETFEWDVDAREQFMIGMIDADGYVNSSNTITTIQIGSTNKELALQQMLLAQSLGFNASVYENHYRGNRKDCVRYRVEFYPTKEFVKKITCKKKASRTNDSFERTNDSIRTHGVVTVASIKPLEKEDFSYDVTTESEHFTVSGIYSHNCRSFLTPDRIQGNTARALNYKEGEGKYYGRFNIGVVSVNLPDIALSANGNMNEFWRIFEERTELAHKAIRCRIDKLSKVTSDVAPILWQNGAFARLKKHESIAPLLYGGYATASLGYVGLYECVKAMLGVSHTTEKGKEFGLQVMQALNDKCAQWKDEENIDYSLYGTPAESLVYKFATKLKKRWGDDLFVKLDGKDREYITNSYHVPVFENINAFDKLTKEADFQKLSPGGAISYVEVPNMNNNVQAVITLIKHIYDTIMYAEMNTRSDVCNVCGYHGEIGIAEEKVTDAEGKETISRIWKCPQCGNTDPTKMNVARRTCGYIGVSSNGWNTGKLDEFEDRVLHL